MVDPISQKILRPFIDGKIKIPARRMPAGIELFKKAFRKAFEASYSGITPTPGNT